MSKFKKFLFISLFILAWAILLILGVKYASAQLVQWHQKTFIEPLLIQAPTMGHTK